MSNLKTKKEVYVKVDTRKQAEKLKKVLEMFGQDTYTSLTIKNALTEGHAIFFDNEHWLTCYYTGNLEQVSIKELRNILAHEPLQDKQAPAILKVGDVCKFQYSRLDSFIIGVLKEIDEDGGFWCNGDCYPRAEVVDKDEVIELLFGDKE